MAKIAETQPEGQHAYRFLLHTMECFCIALLHTSTSPPFLVDKQKTNLLQSACIIAKTKQLKNASESGLLLSILQSTYRFS